MLRSTRRGILRYSYEVTEDGEPVATLAGARREGCTFQLDGEAYTVSRKGYREFVLAGPAGELAAAKAAGSRMWTVRSMTDMFELVRISMVRSSWELRRFGQPAGTLRREGFRSRGVADLPGDLPLPVRLFVLFVVETLWARSEGA